VPETMKRGGGRNRTGSSNNGVMGVQSLFSGWREGPLSSTYTSISSFYRRTIKQKSRSMGEASRKSKERELNESKKGVSEA